MKQCGLCPESNTKITLNTCERLVGDGPQAGILWRGGVDKQTTTAMA
jgi:hypothetical protein